MNRYLKMLLFVLYDVVALWLSFVIGMLLLRYSIGEVLLEGLWFFIICSVLVVAFNFVNKLYSRVWAHAGLVEAVRLCVTGVVVFLLNLAIQLAFIDALKIEWTIIASLFTFLFMVFGRFASRIYRSAMFYIVRRNKVQGQKRVMIIGAGFTGASLIREMRSRVESNLYPVCALDDDPEKLNSYVSGVKVVGKTSEVETFAKKYNVDQIILTMPSAEKKVLKEVALKSKKTGKIVRSVPSMLQYTNGSVSISDIKDVKIEDLLGRDQVKTDLGLILGYIKDKTVLVTGGGGSIGSELCRQIAIHNPKKLIILDIYENNAYEIEQELIRNLPNLDLTVLIASVRDEKKIRDVFGKYKPEIVFHAAAHKHVPLMETSPNEAVKNNVFGTLNVARTAGEFGVERFILISTDKAVNPTNIMGATKRICEMIVQTLDKHYTTEYVAVRFGNVLGSNGSVIPLFKKQIEEGGPVTVTHKDIVRYFMTIPEAVSLVLQAGAFAKGGEIFVLDMGEPVKIYDLAENIIKLSGFTPNVDIDIKITGLRPGEKLYEERLMEEEGLQRTENEMISIGKPLEIDEQKLFSSLALLKEKAEQETDQMKELVHELVPTYKIDFRS